MYYNQEELCPIINIVCLSNLTKNVALISNAMLLNVVTTRLAWSKFRYDLGDSWKYAPIIDWDISHNHVAFSASFQRLDLSTIIFQTRCTKKTVFSLQNYGKGIESNVLHVS